jgi:hypothetical protein
MGAEGLREDDARAVGGLFRLLLSVVRKNLDFAAVRSLGMESWPFGIES